jgi:hypothetical protein
MRGGEDPFFSSQRNTLLRFAGRSINKIDDRADLSRGEPNKI